MYYSPEMMRDFLTSTLGPELERSGWGTDKLKVMIWDHNLDHVQEWVKVIFADEKARKYAAGTAIHWYSHTPQTVLDEPHKLHPDKFLLATEACKGVGVNIGGWDRAEDYAKDIIMVRNMKLRILDLIVSPRIYYTMLLVGLIGTWCLTCKEVQFGLTIPMTRP